MTEKVANIELLEQKNHRLDELVDTLKCKIKTLQSKLDFVEKKKKELDKTISHYCLQEGDSGFDFKEEN